ncbi:MAG: iron ABC transporter permease, partial [Chitinophagales bacterium]|nr:iron ABC transporter permease [Chitinophagales bacterium]
MKTTTVVSILFLSTVFIVLLAISKGAATIGFPELTKLFAYKLHLVNEPPSVKTEAIVWSIRTPRVLLCLMVGAVMGICGAAMQGLFRNPLADPYLVGISAGASLSAALVIVLGVSFFSEWSIYMELSVLSISTFIGAVLATLLIFSLSVSKGKADVATMLLVGIAINAFAMAFVGLLTFLSTEPQLRSLTFWTMGSMGGATWTSVALMTIVALITIIGLYRLYKALNLLSLGEDEAGYIGISVDNLKKKILIYTALGVGISVALCGMIGFIGLVIPHLARVVLGADNRLVLPVSALGGAFLLCGADLMARVIFPPSEVPIGVITALMGAPFFMFLLKQKGKEKTIYNPIIATATLRIQFS